MSEDFKKPIVKLVGEDGNVFNLMSICAKALKKEHYNKEADEMINRITGTAKSYDESLQIMCEYVNPVGQEYDEDLDYDHIDIQEV